jgi:hypothetical protein
MCFKLNGTHQLLFYAAVDIWGASVHTVKKRTEALVFANKEIGQEVNAEKIKYMVMPQEKKSGKNHNIKISSKSFEMEEQFIYLATTLTNQNYIHKEIKSGLKSENVCYHSAQNVLSSGLIPKNIKVKICRNITLPVLYVCVCMYVCVKLGFLH